MINRFGLYLILVIFSTTIVNGQLKLRKDSINNIKRINVESVGDTAILYSDQFKIPKIFIDSKPVYGVEDMPEFPGGEDSLRAFISRNINYSKLNRSIVSEGRVYIRVTIIKNGSIKDINVIRKLEPTYDKEAIRVISKMPRWTPGEVNGRKCNVYCTICVIFRKKDNY